MQQWEFKTVLFEYTDLPNFASTMEKLGNNGWQMVQFDAAYKDGAGLVVVLQRPKQTDLMRLLRHIVECYYENGGISQHLIDKLDSAIEE